MKIVVDKDIPYIHRVLEPFAQVLYIKGTEISPEDVADADAMIVRTRTRCNKALLEGSTVRIVATATIGYDHIDTKWCESNGIRVATAAGCNSRGVLQWFGAAVANQSQRYGWAPEQLTLGVVGVGNVGSLVAEYAKLWGFKVLCSDPPREQQEGLGAKDGFVAYNELIDRCNVLTYHTPLKSEGMHPTQHLFNLNTVKRLNPHTTILNSSRGEVTDTQALLAAMDNGHRVVIDTWENEPQIDIELLQKCDTATPHIAGYSIQGKAMATAMSVSNIATELGFPLNGWYPVGIPKSISGVKPSWAELSQSIRRYFDITELSQSLKSDPRLFEQLRNNYQYREEYF